MKAACVYRVTDSDMESGYRDEVNYQLLCFVTSDPNVQLCCDPHHGGDGHVIYTRVYAADTNTSYLNLRDSEKRNLRDSEGRQLRVHKTDEDMLKVRNLGKKSYEEVIGRLNDLGLSLRQSDDE